VIGDATPERFAKALRIVLTDPNVDTVLAILSPQAMTNPTQTAEQVSLIPIPPSKRLVAAWMGGLSMQAGIEILQSNGIRNFDTPEQAIRGLIRLIEYKKSNRRLRILDPSDTSRSLRTCNQESNGSEQASERLERKRFLETLDPLAPQDRSSRTVLSEVDSKRLLNLYRIPTTPIEIASNADQAVALADAFGYPVVLKIHSPQITHKTDVGGVMLSLQDPEAVANAFHSIERSVSKARPDATIQGITVQPMIHWTHCVELIFGSKHDPVFGPVVLVGFGGVTAELFKDRAIGLPPITPERLMAMLKSLQCWPLLDGYRQRPKANIEALVDVMTRYSELISEQDWIQESDLNPVLVDERQAIVLDARFIG
jgi:acetyltransferase